MSKTLADRLQRVSDGYRIKLDDLEALKDELAREHAKLAETLAELEGACTELDEDTEALLDKEGTPREDRAGYWEDAASAAAKAIDALKAIDAWRMP